MRQTSDDQRFPDERETSEFDRLITAEQLTATITGRLCRVTRLTATPPPEPVLTRNVGPRDL